MWHARECILNECWQIFVDDRRIPQYAINSRANVQPKAVFSYAMTVMDKICGWEDEQKTVVSLFAACMWIDTKAVLCDGQESMQDYLVRRLLSIRESVNRVCEEALEDHQWVSELTISMQENEVLAELDHEIDIPCVVQWGLLWSTAPSRLNVKLDVEYTRITKFHEVTNLAINAATKAPYGGRDIPRPRLVWSIAKVLDGLSDEDWDGDWENHLCFCTLYFRLLKTRSVRNDVC